MPPGNGVHVFFMESAAGQRRRPRGVVAGVYRATATAVSTTSRAVRPRHAFGAAFLCLVAAAFAPGISFASTTFAVNAARQAVCAPHARYLLTESRAANAVAARLSHGDSLHSALGTLPARPSFASSMHLVGLNDDHAVATSLANRFCHDLAEPTLREVGSARVGNDLWIVVLAPLEVPAPGDQAAVGREVLARVNAARASGYRCGNRSFASTGPLRLSGPLSSVALLHSTAMARSNSLEHVERDGSTPSDRVRRSGYLAGVVGENIAGGVASATDAVAGWLASPGHCANLMDSRFKEMGLAFAVEPNSQYQIYWTQLFAVPR